jgi:DUF1365 family protein
MSRLAVMLIVAPLTTCTVQAAIAWRGHRLGACGAWVLTGLVVASGMAFVAHHAIAP